MVQLLNDLHLRAAQLLDKVAYGVPLAFGIACRQNHRAGTDSTGIDQRSRGVVVLEQKSHYRVEGQPRSVSSDFVENSLCRVLIHRQQGCRHLRYGLDTE